MIAPFLPLAAEANNALDVLLKGLDTVVAQAVAEAGDKAGAWWGTRRSAWMRSAHVTVQGQHFCSLGASSKFISSFSCPTCGESKDSNRLGQATEEEVTALAVKLNVFHTMTFLTQSLGSNCWQMLKRHKRTCPGRTGLTHGEVFQEGLQWRV